MSHSTSQAESKKSNACVTLNKPSRIPKVKQRCHPELVSGSCCPCILAIFQKDPEQNKIYAASPLDFQFFQDDRRVKPLLTSSFLTKYFHPCHPELVSGSCCPCMLAIFQKDPEQNKIYAASPLDFQFFQDDRRVLP